MIDKVGLLLIRNGRVLLCRKKRGTSSLILPGGKREAGESALECLARELEEELGQVAMVSPAFVGVYTHQAASDKADFVRVELYRAELTGEPHAQSEIAHMVWFGVEDDWSRLAPSLAKNIFPDLIARGILDAAWTAS